MALTIALPAAAENRHLTRHAEAARTIQHATTRRDLSFDLVTLPDGRVAYPGIVQYRRDDGAVLDCPPLDGGRFSLVIHDLAAYEDLARSGRLYHPAHVGRPVEITDNRRTS